MHDGIARPRSFSESLAQLLSGSGGGPWKGPVSDFRKEEGMNVLPLKYIPNLGVNFGFAGVYLANESVPGAYALPEATSWGPSQLEPRTWRRRLSQMGTRGASKPPDVLACVRLSWRHFTRCVWVEWG